MKTRHVLSIISLIIICIITLFQKPLNAMGLIIAVVVIGLIIDISVGNYSEPINQLNKTILKSNERITYLEKQIDQLKKKS